MCFYVAFDVWLQSVDVGVHYLFLAGIRQIHYDLVEVGDVQLDRASLLRCP